MLSFSTPFHAPFRTAFHTPLRTALGTFRINIVAQNDDVIQMTVISFALAFCHPVHLQAFAHLRQAGGVGCFGNLTRIQIVDPFLQRGLGHFVEVVHLQDIILRIKLAHGIHLKGLPLERSQFQYVVLMDAAKFRLAMVHDILAMPQGEINDVHAVHLAHVLISLATVDVFRHQLRHAEQHALKISVLIVVLHLDEYQFPFGIQGQQIHTVVLVELVFLIAFALQ